MNTLIVRTLGKTGYQETFDAMRKFTDNRNAETIDEIWLTEHFPILTLGQAGKKEHILQNNTLPIIQSDRGGQVTYHGPGQLLFYVLIDINRRKMGVRGLVSSIEQSVIEMLAEYDITAHLMDNAPGVYVNHNKIASIGLRIRRGYSYHGLSLNIDMDLSPFDNINPCGYAGLKVVQMNNFLEKPPPAAEIANRLVKHFAKHLGYNNVNIIEN